MNIDHLLTSTATLTSVTADGAADEFGDPTEATSTVTYRCWLSQTQRSEVTGNVNTQTDTWTLYLEAAAADADGYDRVVVDGISYEFDGPPWPARNPRTQQLSHVEATVRRSR